MASGGRPSGDGTGEEDAGVRYVALRSSIARRASTKPSSTTGLSADARVVLLIGPELFLHAEHTRALRAALAERHGFDTPDQIDTIRFDGSATPVADVLDECRTFGLMQQPKLVVVDQADQLVKEASRPMMERYAQQPTEHATLVLRAAKWNAGKLDAMISQVGVILKCEPMAPWAAAKWAVERARSPHGAEITPPAAERLVARAGTDMARLDQELAKLSLYAGGQRAIAPADVETMVESTRQEEPWGLQETLIAGDGRAILGQVRTILENGPRDMHVPTTYVCVDLARKVHAVSRGMAQGARPAELAQRLRLWPVQRADAIAVRARALGPEAAAALLHAAVEADARQKSGFGRGDRAVEALALRFASRR